MIAKAGNQEKGDVLLEIERFSVREDQSGGNTIEVSSRYDALFGNHLRGLLNQLTAESGLSPLHIRAFDNGAWDYTVKARFEYCVKQLKEAL